MASLITHRLGATFPGFRDQSLSRGLFWGTTGVALLAPVIAFWIYLTFIYSYPGAGCDRLFWEQIVGNSFAFPFLFSLMTLKYSIVTWIILGLGIVVLLYAYIKGFHLLRLQDLPWAVIGPFMILAALTFFSFLGSLDLYGREYMKRLFDNDTRREGMLQQNIETLRNALLEQARIQLSPSNRESLLDEMAFSTDRPSDTVGSPKELFSMSSQQPLFDGCRASVGLEIRTKTREGFGAVKNVNVPNVIMPVAFRDLIKAPWWHDAAKRFGYYADVFGVMYLFSWLWWVYFIWVTMPIWLFFLVFFLYKVGSLRIRGRI
ncbi:MAG: hypothetical protein HQK58_06495 [Deltaproteobacteria bacterium]|nr:hypothetical protein [Deltaproteobacteria bacterium]